MGTPFTLWLDDAAASGNPLLGGKFANLAEMTASGVSVPRGFGITTAAYRQFLASAGLADEARRIRLAAACLEPHQIRNETRSLLEGIATAPLPAQLEQEIRENYALLGRRCDAPDLPVAVRSSGESEDLAGASFAGQYETFLWICGADAVLRHVRGCWAGMFGEAVLSYRQDGENVMSKGDFAICVGIQEMVEARAAGVMFTLDPITGDRSKIVIESCWGLGEGVVKGDVTPSQFTVDKVTFEITGRRIHPQSHEYRFVAGEDAVRLAPIETERRDSVCISDETVRALAQLAKEIERRRGAPQDIEWAVDRTGAVRVLQVRPETVWSRREAPAVVVAAKSPVAHVLARLSGVKVTAPVRKNGP